MNVICPRCNSDKTSPFYDTIYKTSGYYCENCKQDFAVDDANHSFDKKLEKIKYITFIFKKDENNLKEVDIENKTNKVLIIKEKKDGRLISNSEINIDEEYSKLMNVLFKQCFLMDFPSYKEYDNNKNYFNINLNINGQLISFNYNDNNKPYYIDIIKAIFDSFFEVENDKH